MTGQNNKRQPIYWATYKSNPAATQMVGFQVMTFADPFDSKSIIKFDLAGTLLSRYSCFERQKLCPFLIS